MFGAFVVENFSESIDRLAPTPKPPSSGLRPFTNVGLPIGVVPLFESSRSKVVRNDQMHVSDVTHHRWCVNITSRCWRQLLSSMLATSLFSGSIQCRTTEPKIFPAAKSSKVKRLTSALALNRWSPTIWRRHCMRRTHALKLTRTKMLTNQLKWLQAKLRGKLSCNAQEAGKMLLIGSRQWISSRQNEFKKQFIIVSTTAIALSWPEKWSQYIGYTAQTHDYAESRIRA